MFTTAFSKRRPSKNATPNHIQTIPAKKNEYTGSISEAPIFEAIDILAKNDYKGYYSFEWEKMWHPEIEEPEIALADYPKAMREHFKA